MSENIQFQDMPERIVTRPDCKGGQGEILTVNVFSNTDDDVDLIKSRLRSQSANSTGSASEGSHNHSVLLDTLSSKSNTNMSEIPDLEPFALYSDISDISDSLCQSTETLIDNLDITLFHNNFEDTRVHDIKTESSHASLTGSRLSDPNGVASLSSLKSGLVISPISLTQDIPVNMGCDNKRISSVLESLDLQLVYLPKTKQLVAAKNVETDNAMTNGLCDKQPDYNKIYDNTQCSSDTSPDVSNISDSSPTSSTTSSPTKMFQNGSLDGKFHLPGGLDDTSSMNCETDFLLKVKEPDQLTCGSSEFDTHLPRNCTNGSLMRTFTDASSLSSISTSTDFSVSAASLDDAEGTGLCIDTGDAGFMEINLHSRNSFERAKNPSQDSGFEDRSAKPKRKGLTSFLTRNLFSRKGKEENDDQEQQDGGILGWKLFGKVPPKLAPNKDPKQILSEYQAKKQVNLAANNRSKKADIEVMSTTALILENRPMNLPTKDPEEAERHRQEYEAMVEAAKRKEQKELKQKRKQIQQQLRQEEQLLAASKAWIEEILPNWDSMKHSKKTKELWWHGLPPKVRGKVWQLAIGNDLNITQELYDICVSRAEDRIKAMDETSETFGTSETSSEPPSSKESSVELIKLDVSRTFPHLCIFQKGGPYHDLLHSLLGAYACYRPDVGYVQGMLFIAAVLLLNMEVAEAFISFANLLNKPCQVAFFRIDEEMMKVYFKVYDDFFIENMPALQKHFVKNSLTPDLYLIDWIFSLFSKSLPLDVACRVWDVFCRDGEEFLFRTALGILKLYEKVLMSLDFIHLAQFLTRLPEDIQQDHLFKAIEHIQMTVDKKKFSQILAAKRDAKETT
ncbi:hypothetical protein CHS0354_003630 [Potamilus streckersoni]|uniref:Rab-GAP TBC domain-containing protein n=1 Tax=Potamilus streckersoni TaxID=2493646 RepID=A0AAE0VR33_9BIVA|nr:hypothetical protein CHS0354_003630 [Potamilus streckersoni]